MRDPGRAPALPCRPVQADLGRDRDPADWLPRLKGVDVVINAVGILRESGGQRFRDLHVEGPRALFLACTEAGVRRVVQISALGADAGARSAYHLSKREADEFLLSLPLSAVIVQPSLVYGPGGASARLFTRLASLPLIPVPGEGRQQIQPIFIDDAVEAMVALVETDAFRSRRVALVGPRPLAYRDFLAELREALGLPPAHFLKMPMALVRSGAAIGDRLPGGLLDTETLDMLERGNTAPPDATVRLLGREPRPPAEFVAETEREGSRTTALLSWLLPLLRWSVALVWIVTGIVSLGVYPVSESYGLLARTGITGALAPVALYGAALLDLALGFAILFHRRPWLWLVQIGLMLGYTAIITLRLPEFWLHPYGPILKNLPLLAVFILLYVFEDR